VYEDDELLVFFKPSGLASMPTREQVQHNLKTLLLSYLGPAFTSSSLHMPSRLDTSVSGLVLVSKHPAMHRPLQRLFEHRRLRKLYVLRTQTSLAWNTFDALGSIGRDPRHPVLRCVTATAGKAAHTVFTKLIERSSGSYLAAQPVTGRTHQIRVHASSYGFPIDGDNFYAGAENPELALMSAALRFIHPHSHRELLILAPATALPYWVATEWKDIEPELRRLLECGRI
jgi:23S rRNA-/tRNA-specific pseudouridylate synthase